MDSLQLCSGQVGRPSWQWPAALLRPGLALSDEARSVNRQNQIIITCPMPQNRSDRTIAKRAEAEAWPRHAV